LAAQFEMKDIGKLKYFIGIEVAYSKKGIFISQRKYVLDLLKETSWDVEPREFLFNKIIELEMKRALL